MNRPAPTDQAQRTTRQRQAERSLALPLGPYIDCTGLGLNTSDDHYDLKLLVIAWSLLSHADRTAIFVEMARCLRSVSEPPMSPGGDA